MNRWDRWLLGASSLWLLLSPFVWSADLWDKQFAVDARKDEWVTMRFYDKTRTYDLNFSWTLFHNDALTLFVNYQSQRYQPVLYPQPGLNAFVFNLLPRAGDDEAIGREPPFAVIRFAEYDAEEKRVQFDVMIRDHGRTEVERIERSDRP